MRSKGADADQGGEPPGGIVAGEHGEDAFAATFLERWDPAAVAKDLVGAMVGLLKLPLAGPSVAVWGGPAAGSCDGPMGPARNLAGGGTRGGGHVSRSMALCVCAYMCIYICVIDPVGR